MVRRTGRPPANKIEIYPMGDPRWEDLSRPLLEFLSKPRLSEELKRWRDESDIGVSRFPNCLAWLETKGLARNGYNTDGVLYWVKVGYRTFN
jgi:hypothetical protein